MKDFVHLSCDTTDVAPALLSQFEAEVIHELCYTSNLRSISPELNDLHYKAKKQL